MGNLHSQYSLIGGGGSHGCCLLLPIFIAGAVVVLAVLGVLQWYGIISFLSVIPFLVPSSSSSDSPPLLTTTPTGSGYDNSVLSQLLLFHNGTTYSTDSFSFSSTGDSVIIPTYMNTTGVEHGWLNIPGIPQDVVNTPPGFPQVSGPTGFPMDTATNAAGTTIPIGITSAVPLGGVGTGNYEVRADGKMYQSTIRNQDMAGEPWQGTVRDFLMIVTINGVRYSVQIGTKFSGLTPVPKLVYQGLFPLSKLSFLGMSLYMYSAITPVDLDTSNTPAVAFSLHYTNTGSSPVTVSFTMNMPFGLRNDWTQMGPAATTLSSSATTAASCARACGSTCHAWQFNRATAQCLGDTAYTQGYNLAGVDSGHPGVWSSTPNSIGFQHNTGTQGFNGLGQQVLYSPDPTEWVQTWSTDTVASNSTGNLFAVMSVGSPSPLQPGESIQLTIVHAWYFPTHYWSRDQGGVDYGNAYNNRFTTALDAAKSMNHSLIAQNLVNWQTVFSGLPSDIQDNLFNGLSHIRNAMYFRNGDWRHWEGYGFVDTDSVHNDAERRVQYFNYYPSTERNKILAWANIQLPNGMIQEQFNGGFSTAPTRDAPVGRVMSDVTQIYICLVLEHVILHNDSALLQQLYIPTLIPALNWMMNQAAASPWKVPAGLTQSYDVELEGIYGASLYSYTMYAVGLKCGRQAALYMQDTATAATVQTAFIAAKQSVETHLWMSPYYTAETFGANLIYDYMQGLPIRSSDGLHGQVEAYRLNLGDLLDLDRMKTHLISTLGYLQTPYGMEFNKHYARYNNYAMADHSTTALLLWWNEQGSDVWNQSTQQIRHIRDTKLDLWRPSCVYETNYGANWLLNYYGWIKWSEQSLQAFSGQHTNLYEGWLSFSPHSSAFVVGQALVPVQWGGYVGYLTLTSTTATITTVFAEQAFFFNTITVCGTAFTSASLTIGSPWHVTLPHPCASMTGNSSIAQYQAANPCTLTNQGNYQVPGLYDVNSQVMNPTQCSAAALSSRALCMVAFPLWPGGGACPYPGQPCCYLGFDATVCASTSSVPYPASFGNVLSAQVQCTPSSCTQSTTYQNQAFDQSVFALTTTSYILVQPLPSADLCQAQAIQYGVCGWVWYSLSPMSQNHCTSQSPCCFLNMYTDCRTTPKVAYTGSGVSTLGYLNCTRRDFSLGGQYNS